MTGHTDLRAPERYSRPMKALGPRTPLRHWLPVLLAVVGGPCLAQTPTTLTVNVILNQPEAGGTLRLALCPNRASYETETACSTLSVPASGRTITANFEDVQPGPCAVKVFHDINDDGKLNTTWIGWPKEPYGFSNDAPVNMGPPPFKLAMIELKEGANSTRITMR